MMNISIFGLGYVGAVSLACLARDGHDVTGVDIAPEKLELIRSGRTPVVEEGMVDLIARVVAEGRVRVDSDTRAAVLRSDLSLVCVGTPSAPNGSQDQSAILRIAADIGAALREKSTPHVVAFRSTLAPGTVEDVLRPLVEAASGKRDGVDFHLCFQPEFLREGSAIRDYDAPPFVVVGACSDFAVERIRDLFGHLPCRFLRTSIRAAETVKYCCNNFHALKIVFANETARLCEALGVDPFEVMNLVCSDTQLNISPAYLRPGFAFGGSCLGKDLRATLHLARTRDVELPVLGSVLESNSKHLEHAISKILASGKRHIGLVGLSFKPGTDDLRESPLVHLAERCLGKGLSLVVYDPSVHLSKLLGANLRYIEATVPHLGKLLREHLEEVVAESELLVVALADPGTVEVLVREVRPDQLVLDLVRIPDAAALRGRYMGLCW